jgi:hypothetical protein
MSKTYQKKDIIVAILLTLTPILSFILVAKYTNYRASKVKLVDYSTPIPKTLIQNIQKHSPFRGVMVVRGSINVPTDALLVENNNNVQEWRFGGKRELYKTRISDLKPPYTISKKKNNDTIYIFKRNMWDTLKFVLIK